MSIVKMNASLVEKLKEAAEIGYHVDDLAKALNFSTKKEVQTRLYDLQNKGEVQRLPGNKWRVTQPTEPAQDGKPAVKEAPLDVHPSIKLPGIAGFSSYKNSLQEYCQKRHLGVPSYIAKKEAGGYSSTVSFGTNCVTGSQARSFAKEADQQAAMESLIALEYLPKGSVFQEAVKPVPGQKRKEAPTAMDHSGPPQKQTSPVEGTSMFKSKLNELAQKNKLPAPTYDTVGTPNGFFSTVSFNGRPFKSSTCLPKKKDSEQNAAHMAMWILKQVPSPPEGFNPEQEGEPNGDAIESMITEARQLVSGGKQNPAIEKTPKTRLQEYCQRMKLSELPKYSTDVRQDKSVISTVVVAMSSYTGDVSNSKKLAEQSAAVKALLDLGLAAEKGATNGANPIQMEA